MFGTALATQGQPKHNPNQDIEIQCPPDCDSFSSLKFSPSSDLLCASNWNNSVYIWDVQSQTGQAVAKAQNKDHQQPVLSTSWNQDGTQVFTAGCDKTARLWNLATNQSQQVRCDCDTTLLRVACLPVALQAGPGLVHRSTGRQLFQHHRSCYSPLIFLGSCLQIMLHCVYGVCKQAARACLAVLCSSRDSHTPLPHAHTGRPA